MAATKKLRFVILLQGMKMNPENWTDRRPSAEGSLSGRYLDEAINSKFFVDMLALGMFPNAKEVTESLAMYAAVRKYCPWKFSDSKITLISVGDGTQPRTAATFAFRSAWDCFSVDPRLNNRGDHSAVKRLRMLDERIEDCHFVRNHPVVIVACHSHAHWKNVFKHVEAPEIMAVALPCCESHHLDVPPDFDYDDHRCWSPKRRVMIWMPESVRKIKEMLCVSI